MYYACYKKPRNELRVNEHSIEHASMPALTV